MYICSDTEGNILPDTKPVAYFYCATTNGVGIPAGCGSVSLKGPIQQVNAHLLRSSIVVLNGFIPRKMYKIAALEDVLGLAP